MSFSSFKKDQLIFENFRKFVKEDSADPLQKVAYKLGDPSTPLAQYVAILKKYASDPTFNALATAGRDDGDPNDERVSVKRGSTAAKNLTATQAEIGFDNSLADQVTNKYKATEAALGLAGTPIIMPSVDTPPPAILVYNGKYVLDGHHRWSQVMVTNPDGDVAVDNVTGPALDDEEEALKAMQLAIAGGAKKVVTKPFSGANLMQASGKQVAQYVLDNITDEVLQLMVKAAKIEKPDKNLAARYIAGNLDTIKKRVGKFSREKSMPQAGKSGVSQGAVNDFLGTGQVNFQDPEIQDIEENKMKISKARLKEIIKEEFKAISSK